MSSNNNAPLGKDPDKLSHENNIDQAAKIIRPADENSEITDKSQSELASAAATNGSLNENNNGLIHDKRDKNRQGRSTSSPDDGKEYLTDGSPDDGKGYLTDGSSDDGKGYLTDGSTDDDKGYVTDGSTDDGKRYATDGRTDGNKVENEEDESGPGVSTNSSESVQSTKSNTDCTYLGDGGTIDHEPKIPQECLKDIREIGMHLYTTEEEFRSCIGEFLYVSEFAKKYEENQRYLLAILKSLEELESSIPEGDLVAKIENKWVVEYMNSRAKADKFCAYIFGQILIWCVEHNVRISFQLIKPENNRVGDSLSSSPPPKLPLGLSVIMYTDATPKGFGGFIGNIVMCAGNFSPQELIKYGNNTNGLESLTILKCFKLLGVKQLLSGTSLVIRSDNLSTVKYIINGGGPKERDHKDSPNDHKDSPNDQDHRDNIAQILKFCGDHNIKVTAQHVCRKNNKLADALSRLSELCKIIKGKNSGLAVENDGWWDFFPKYVRKKKATRTKFDLEFENGLILRMYDPFILFLPPDQVNKTLNTVNKIRQSHDVLLVLPNDPDVLKQTMQTTGVTPVQVKLYCNQPEHVLNMYAVFLPSH